MCKQTHHLVSTGIEYPREIAAKLAISDSVLLYVLSPSRISALSSNFANFPHGSQVNLKYIQ